MDRGRIRARRLTAVAAALALHGVLLLAVVQVAPSIRQRFVTPATPVILAPRLRAEPPPPPPPPPPPRPETRAEAPAAKGPPAASPPPAPAAPARPHPVQAPEARPSPPSVPAPVASPGLSDAEIAGALTAASGEAGAGAGAGAGGGGTGGRSHGCDMIGRLQRVLRADRQVQSAVARAQAPGARPLVVWRGDWVQSSGEAGKGLAGLRQAIAMEVAFAPEACRAEPVRGVVLLSLSDAPGGARIALGSGVWRWSDLLFAQGVRRR